jgi:hypothetical protein
MAKNSNTYKTFNVHEKTPEGFYKQLDEEFHFQFDPCPLNPHPEWDGLEIPWGGQTCYINPPYGKAIRGWLEKALFEVERGATVIFLLPSYTDVKWFHEIVLPHAHEIRFIKGRLKFGEHNNTAPFANMIVIFKPHE